MPFTCSLANVGVTDAISTWPALAAAKAASCDKNKNISFLKKGSFP
jgi:hypothetical protein